MIRPTCLILPFGLMLGAIILGGGDLKAGSTKPKPTADTPVVEARFLNGSLVRMNLVQEPIEVVTVYGKLTVPPSEIRSIDFGWHIDADTQARVNEAIGLLNSSSYKQREQAVNDLIALGAPAYPSLVKASKSKEMEVASRAQKAMKEIEKKVPSRVLNRRNEDVIRARKFIIIGKVSNPTIQARADYFGDLQLRPSQLQSLRHVESADEVELVIDAATHGSSVDTWLETSVEVTARQNLKITATGQVDLWPQGPGQYLSTPNGRAGTRAPLTGPFASVASNNWNAGSLVGKIGPNGTPFLIGENFRGQAPASGRLYLNILMSPWNNASTGSYTVRITVGDELPE